MTAALLALGLLLLAGAVAGPALLGRLAPTLSAHPRAGMAVWTSAAALWTLGFLSAGPLLAWNLTGPPLPGVVGSTCRRCLTAADPFAAEPWATDVPVAVVLLVPAGLLLLLLSRATALVADGRRSVRAQLRTLTAVAELRRVHGTLAWVVPSTERVAYALPRRRGGIVVSQGALDHLTAAEAGAVVAHERAHITGGHHAVLGAARTLAGVFGWVPLVRAAAPAVAGYAEMAADDAARRALGTRALAGALLALHHPGAPSLTPTVALHAARHEPLSRARRLVADPRPPSRVELAVVGTYLVALAAAVAAVSAPYLSLAVAGTC